MNAVTRSWEDGRAVIAVLRAKGVPARRQYADHSERRRDQHAPGEATVRLSRTDDVYLRSYTWARWQLGIPLPPLKR
jgi:hypothetical protein